MIARDIPFVCAEIHGKEHRVAVVVDVGLMLVVRRTFGVTLWYCTFSSSDSWYAGAALRILSSFPSNERRAANNFPCCTKGGS